MTSGLAGTHVSHTIANIGSMVGGIFAPHQDATSKGKQSESTATEPDVAVDDDNILSLTVSSIFYVCSLPQNVSVDWFNSDPQYWFHWFTLKSTKELYVYEYIIRIIACQAVFTPLILNCLKNFPVNITITVGWGITCSHVRDNLGFFFEIGHYIGVVTFVCLCFFLQVDGFYNVSFISIARSGSYLHKLSPKDAVLREVMTVHSGANIYTFWY